MESGMLVRANCEFASDFDGELNLKSGSVLQVIRPVNQHWSYGCLAGLYGNFPTGYVTVVQLPEDVVSLVASSHSAQLFVAKDRFSAANSSQMSFDKGDLILSSEASDDQWNRGRLVNDPQPDRIKSFPVNRTWKIDMDLLKSRLTLNKRVNMKGKVTMSLKAQLDEEIDLFVNDIVTITEIIDDDWYRGHCRGKNGIFPKYVISLLNESADVESSNSRSNSRPSSSLDLLDPFASLDFNSTPHQCDFKESYGLTNNNSLKTSMNGSQLKLPHAKSLFEFYGEFDNELSFGVDETIFLKRRISSDWMEGENMNGKRGIFPSCYVQIVIDVEDEVDFLAPLQPQTEETMVARYDFYPQVDGDVPVMEGEIVTVLEKIDDNWCQVRNAVGLVGLCPATYLLPNDENTQSKLQRHWSLPAHSLKPVERSNAFDSKSVPIELTSRVNERQSSVHFGRAHLDFNQSESGGMQSVKVSPPRPPLPSQGFHETTLGEVQEAQKSTNSARVIRPAPPPPINPGHNIFPKRSHSAVGALSANERRRSEVQLRHKQDSYREKNSQRRKIVTMAEISTSIGSELDKKSIAEMPNDFDSSSQTNGTDSSRRSSMAELKSRNRDKRDMIIGELMRTERDYIYDLEFCIKTFMVNPEEEKRNGLDVDILFGQLRPIVFISKKLLKSLEAVSSQPTEHKQVGNCFLEAADELREAYTKYCCDHDEVIQLLEKYEENRQLVIYIRQKLESGACSNNQVFTSLSSLVIKPIQRITKYPLLLNELVQVTEETSNDCSELRNAHYTMTKVANDINESKRRIDSVAKYREDPNATISSKLSKINYHSMEKKVSRMGMRLSSTLGLVSMTKDAFFDDEEQKFNDLEKSIKKLLESIDEFIKVGEENVQVRMRFSERISDFYDEERSQKIVDNFRTIQRINATTHWPEFKRLVDKRVTEPLVNLLRMFEGPSKLINKRTDKLCDYQVASHRLEKNKDAAQGKALRDDLEMAKKNYTALNMQLIEELPKLTEMATEIFVQCTGSFVYCRAKYVGSAARQFLELAEIMPNLIPNADVITTFKNEHRRLVNHLVGQGLVLPDTFVVHDENDSAKGAAAGKSKPEITINVPQSSSQRAYLQGRYQPNQLYTAVSTFWTDDPVEVSITEGDLVAVLIQKDPLGSSERWCVDNGASKGMVPSKFLAPFNIVSTETDTKGSTSKSEKSFEAPSTFTYSVETYSEYSEIAESRTRSPPPTYAQTQNHYETLDTTGTHRYYEICDPMTETSSDNSSIRSVSPSPSLMSSQPQFYKAVYEFQATGPAELTLIRGQVVRVLQKQDMEGNCEWWIVQDGDGQRGFVPGNYLAPFDSQ